MSTSGDLRQANHIKYTKMLIESISVCASTLTSFTRSDEELMAYQVCGDNIKHAIISDSELYKGQMLHPMDPLTEDYFKPSKPNSGPYKPPPSSPGLFDNFWQQFKPRD